jgi:hypothetical protein
MADERIERNESGKGQDREAGGLTADRFLAPYPRQVREIANELRRLVVETVPNTTEAVYSGWRLIGYRQMDRPRGRYFCFVAPMPDHARHGFEYGTSLTDDHNLLEGDGKQVRYVTVRDRGSIDRERLAALLAESAMIASIRTFL